MMKLNLSIIVCATFLLAPAVSHAQEKTPAPSAQGDGIAEYTIENVDPTKPFGEIDVAKAGATKEEVTAFYNGLTPAQQTEIASRCGVILDPVNQERYTDTVPTELCRNLVNHLQIDR